jgi:uncharacterized damage-inducible protein DinB
VALKGGLNHVLRRADDGAPRCRTGDRRDTWAEGVAMQVSEYQSLLLHMEWADALIWASVLGVPTLRQDERLRGRMYHFHSTQWAYLQVLRGSPLAIPELSSLPDLRSVGSWVRRFYRELPAFRDGLDEARLRQEVEFPWAARVAKRLGSAGPATVGECLLQLVLHTTYHRGQVASRVRETGGEPPLSDFIAWIWLRRPPPGWGSLETD